MHIWTVIVWNWDPRNNCTSKERGELVNLTDMEEKGGHKFKFISVERKLKSFKNNIRKTVFWIQCLSTNLRKQKPEKGGDCCGSICSFSLQVLSELWVILAVSTLCGKGLHCYKYKNFFWHCQPRAQKGKNAVMRVQVGCVKWVWSWAGWLQQEQLPCIVTLP